jgi:hypothetical protein
MPILSYFKTVSCNEGSYEINTLTFYHKKLEKHIANKRSKFRAGINESNRKENQ